MGPKENLTQKEKWNLKKKASDYPKKKNQIKYTSYAIPGTAFFTLLIHGYLHISPI